MTDESATEAVAPVPFSEGVLQGILTACRVLAVRCNSDGRLVYVNQGAVEVLGRPESELLGALMIDVIPKVPVGIYGCEEAISKALQHGVNAQCRFQVGTQENRGDYLLSLVPHIDCNGRVSQLSGVGNKIAINKISVDKISPGRRKLRAASEANHLRDRLLAVVAHEIRNPLSAVSSGIKLLERRLALAEHGDVLQMMNRQVEYLAGIISDLLDVSRFNQGRLLVAKTEISISDIIDSAVEICRGALDRKGHSLRVELPQKPIALRGDRQRLSQVLVNLLDNAAKYTHDGGEIVVSARQDGSHVILAVQDNGVGIPPTEARQIFEVFKQVAQKDGSHKDGLGIGLYLSKMLIKEHGGTIEVHSDGEGHGSTFLVRLPCAPVQGGSLLPA